MAPTPTRRVYLAPNSPLDQIKMYADSATPMLDQARSLCNALLQNIEDHHNEVNDALVRLTENYDESCEELRQGLSKSLMDAGQKLATIQADYLEAPVVTEFVSKGEAICSHQAVCDEFWHKYGNDHYPLFNNARVLSAIASVALEYAVNYGHQLDDMLKNLGFTYTSIGYQLSEPLAGMRKFSQALLNLTETLRQAFLKMEELYKES